MELSLAEKTYWELRQRLLNGHIAPGTQLVHRTLAAELGVSMAPVREAIQRLVNEGFLNHIPGNGAFVRDIDRQDLEELWILREALEGCAAAEAARFINDREIEELEDICSEFDSLSQRIVENSGLDLPSELVDRWLGLEEEFHSIVVNAARNKLLKKIVSDNRALSQVFVAHRFRPGVLNADIAQRTCEGHVELVKALRAREPDAAQKTMVSHIREGRKRVVQFFRNSRVETDSRLVATNGKDA